VAVDGKDITDDGYEFKPGQNLTGIEILLSDRATTLAGTVQDDRERPIGDYTVVAFATDSAKWGYRTRFVRSARPDQNGKFLIKGLPPGAYQVVAVEYLEPGEETDPRAPRELAHNGVERDTRRRRSAIDRVEAVALIKERQCGHDAVNGDSGIHRATEGVQPVC
jgi:Carboxypeptidase regulatory-like domain